MPAVLLGFHPADSCVVMGLDGSSVEFCARLELDWFATHFDQVADQIIEASAQVPGCRFVLIAFGDPDVASLSVVELAGVVGEHRVVESLVADGERYWSLVDDDGSHEYAFDASALAAQAVYEGVRICEDRDEAVAPVELWEPLPSLEQDAAWQKIEGLAEDDRMALLGGLAEAATPPQGDDALMLATLLADEDRATAVLTRLATDNADRIWANLVAARRVAPEQCQPNVVALLGVASWLSGRGAAQTACLEQMARLAPDNPIGSLLSAVHRHGIPPRRWEE